MPVSKNEWYNMNEMVMNKWIWVTVLCLAKWIWVTVLCLAVAACGTGKSSKGQQVKGKAAAALTAFPYPEVPAVMTEPEERLAYLVEHFWERYDFRDTALLRSCNGGRLRSRGLRISWACCRRRRTGHCGNVP